MRFREVIIVLILILVARVGSAQSNISKPRNYHITKEVRPPILNINQETVKFIDSGNNNAIDAGEQCAIEFQVSNDGMGDAEGCEVLISAEGDTQDISYSSIQLNTVSVGKTVDVSIPIISGIDTKDGDVTFTIQIAERQGFGTDSIQIKVNTRKFDAPLLRIVDYSITGASSATTLQRRVPFDLQVLLQNIQYGWAEDVTVTISVPDGVLLLDGDLSTRKFPSMRPGETKSLVYPLIALVNYQASTIPVEIQITEKNGKYAENKQLMLSLNQHLSSTKIVVDEMREERKDIAIGHLSSAVDKNIPDSREVNDKTFALIIANETYQNTSSVPFAINDGGVFRSYCERTLGIPARNIHYLTNATLNNIQGEVSWLENVLRSHEGEAKAIFYYAGHGIPDEASKDSYLLPVDGIANNVRTGYKLQNLYTSLGALPSKSVTFFLDACFSGANRGGDVLVPELRGVVVRANTTAPSGNMVVFSAAQGYETAMPLTEESHGLFTYYLLKKLQETSGEVTYEELSEYILRNVRRQSSILNKTQTPTVIPSAILGDQWKEWKLK